MEARAHLRHARIAPRKVQIVLDLIRNKPVEIAMATLKHTPKAACEYLEKLLDKHARARISGVDYIDSLAVQRIGTGRHRYPANQGLYAPWIHNGYLGIFRCLRKA